MLLKQVKELSEVLAIVECSGRRGAVGVRKVVLQQLVQRPQQLPQSRKRVWRNGVLRTHRTSGNLTVSDTRPNASRLTARRFGMLQLYSTVQSSCTSHSLNDEYIVRLWDAACKGFHKFTRERHA